MNAEHTAAADRRPANGAADLRDAALETPCLVVNRSRLDANCARMRAVCAGRNVTFRPHLKTVKSLDAAKLAMASPVGPATVSTLREAEVFGGGGVSDLLYAVAIAPQKLERVSAIRRSGVDLKIVVDNIDAAQAVAAHSRRTSDSLPVLIEIDVDGHRAGIPLEEKDCLCAVAATLAEGADLRGVMTHAGESYGASTRDELAAAAEQERGGALSMAKALRDAGHACPEVSIGSTPTALSAAGLDGITEVRAGVYIFFDLCQAGIGVCSLDDLAMSVLTTVIGHQRRKDWIIVDAGWMALSADRSTRNQAVDQYFGVVCDIDGRLCDDLVVIRASQEQGVISIRPGSGAAMPDFPVGTRLRILPNHACATAAQHAEYKIVDNANQVVDVWPRFGGW